MAERTYHNFRDFWPFYVEQHSLPLTRMLHFVGSTIGLVLFFVLAATHHLLYWPVCFVIGYGFSWVGHFFVEHNRPATFQYPLYSFMGDWVMWSKIVTGRMSAEADRILHDRARA